MDVKELFDKYYSRLAREGILKALFCGLIVGFAVNFVVAFIAWNLQRKLEESKEWTDSNQAAKAKGEETGLLHAFKLLFTNSKIIKTV